MSNFNHFWQERIHTGDDKMKSNTNVEQPSTIDAEPRLSLKKETIRSLTSQQLTVVAAGACPMGSATSVIPTQAVNTGTNVSPTCGG